MENKVIENDDRVSKILLIILSTIFSYKQQSFIPFIFIETEKHKYLHLLMVIVGIITANLGYKLAKKEYNKRFKGYFDKKFENNSYVDELMILILGFIIASFLIVIGFQTISFLIFIFILGLFPSIMNLIL